MMAATRVGVLLWGLSWLAASDADGQGYRLRLDSRFQSVAFRGVSLDSILASAIVTGASGGFQSPDGFAVRCVPGEAFCRFFRPGPNLKSAPLVTTGDLTLWGLGIRGLSLRANGRWGTDLSSGDRWPGTQPAAQLLEGYIEYSAERLTGRLGRQQVTGRLGWIGFDGADVVLRAQGIGLDLSGYVGWGLSRGSNVPINSPSLNPLDDFQLSRRHVLAGAALGWRSRYADARLEYRRELDPSVDYFISERTALTATFRPTDRLSVNGATEYDLAQGWWGSSDLSLRYHGRFLDADGGVRRYRPHFELWTIWGAFSPAPYTTVNGSVTASPVRQLRLRAGGERYWFDETEAETALTSFEDRGWRLSFGATALLAATLTVDGGYHAEFGPGASSRTWDGRVTYLPTPRVSLSLFGSTLARPLEFRFDEAQVDVVGLDAELRASDQLHFALSGGQYFEERRRPDAGAFDWNQFRVQARVTWIFGSGADQNRLPPAIRRGARRPAR